MTSTAHRALVRGVLVAVAALAAGCTFLIDFKEVDDGGVDAGTDDVDSSNPDTGPTNDANDANVDAGPLAFPPPCDPNFPLAQVMCNASFPRPNCAQNMTVFPTYPAGHPRDGDLVTCNGSTKPTCVQHCPFGCAAMPTGFPDACDDCDGRKDGTYCMKDLRGPDGRNLGLAVDCVLGKTVGTHVCGVGLCATVCTRTSPQPSCCK